MQTDSVMIVMDTDNMVAVFVVTTGTNTVTTTNTATSVVKVDALPATITYDVR